MPNLNIIKLITLKVFEILTPKADIRQKLSFYYRPKFNLGTEWNQEKYWSSLQDSFFTGSISQAKVSVIVDLFCQIEIVINLSPF